MNQWTMAGEPTAKEKSTTNSDLTEQKEITYSRELTLASARQVTTSYEPRNLDRYNHSNK